MGNYHEELALVLLPSVCRQRHLHQGNLMHFHLGVSDGRHHSGAFLAGLGGLEAPNPPQFAVANQTECVVNVTK